MVGILIFLLLKFTNDLILGSVDESEIKSTNEKNIPKSSNLKSRRKNGNQDRDIKPLFLRKHGKYYFICFIQVSMIKVPKKCDHTEIGDANIPQESSVRPRRPISKRVCMRNLRH